MRNASKFPLTELIADLSIRSKPLPEINRNIADGKYRPASEEHIKGYVEQARGKQ